MPSKLTNEDIKELSKRLHAQLGAWNQNETLGEDRIRLAADILHCLAMLDKFSDMKTFVSGLDEKCLQKLAKVKKSFVSLAKLMTQQGKFAEVYTMINNAEFPGGTDDLIKLWDDAHYKEKEAEIRGPLTPLRRFRIRQKYPPPASVCPTGKRCTSALPVAAKEILREWLKHNEGNPYPSREEKEELAERAHLSPFQVRTWFANARRRHKKKSKTSVHDLKMKQDVMRAETKQCIDTGHIGGYDTVSMAELQQVTCEPADLNLTLLSSPHTLLHNNNNPTCYTKTTSVFQDENNNIVVDKMCSPCVRPLSFVDDDKKEESLFSLGAVQMPAWSGERCAHIPDNLIQAPSTDQIVPNSAATQQLPPLPKWTIDRAVSVDACVTPDGASSSARGDSPDISSISSTSSWSESEKSVNGLKKKLFHDLGSNKNLGPPNTSVDFPSLFPWPPPGGDVWNYRSHQAAPSTWIPPCDQFMFTCNSMSLPLPQQPKSNALDSSKHDLIGSSNSTTTTFAPSFNMTAPSMFSTPSLSAYPLTLMPSLPPPPPYSHPRHQPVYPPSWMSQSSSLVSTQPWMTDLLRHNHNNPASTNISGLLNSLRNSDTPSPNVTPPWFLPQTSTASIGSNQKSQENEVAQALLNLSHRQHMANLNKQ